MIVTAYTHLSCTIPTVCQACWCPPTWGVPAPHLGCIFWLSDAFCEERWADGGLAYLHSCSPCYWEGETTAREGEIHTEVQKLSNLLQYQYGSRGPVQADVMARENNFVYRRAVGEGGGQWRGGMDEWKNTVQYDIIQYRVYEGQSTLYTDINRGILLVIQ